MIDLLPQAAALIFTVEGIAVLILGTMLGVVLGALPESVPPSRWPWSCRSLWA